MAFHQGLYSLLKQKKFSGERFTISIVNNIFDPSIYIMNYSDFMVSNIMENTTGLKRFLKCLHLGCAMLSGTVLIQI